MNAFAWVFLIGVLVRVVGFIVGFHISNYDTQSWTLVGEATRQGISVYPDIAALHQPYIPFFIYLTALPLMWIKVLLLLLDMGNLCLVYLLSKRNIPISFLYAANPITVMITAIHGQFDVLPVFFLLWAVYLLQNNYQWRSILVYSLAIASKTWPIFFAFSFMRRVRPWYAIVLAALVPVLCIAVYGVIFEIPWASMIMVIKNYRGVFGTWGLGQLVYMTTGISSPHETRWLRILFFAALGVIALAMRRKDILDEILTLLLFFYAATFAFATQYLAWLVPFLLLRKPWGWASWFFGASLYLVFIYTGAMFISVPMGVALWTLTIIMSIRTMQGNEKRI